MLERDEINIKRLVKWIADNADYGDISELCNELNVSEDWFSRFYEFEEVQDDEMSI